MPELPEVEVIRRSLQNRVQGGSIVALHVNRADIVRAGLPTVSWYTDTIITGVTRRGKCVIFTCQGTHETRHIVSELGMTGLWFFQQNLAASPQHLHVHLTLSGTTAHDLHYWNPRRFGRIWLLNDQELETFVLRRFGPEALDLNESTFVALVKGCRGRLKPFLLDQHHMAGIGNIYANEILFRAGIHPHARGNRLHLTTCHRLFHAMGQTFQEAIAAGGSSIRDFRAPDGSRGHFQEAHLVYQKERHPCPHGCQASITRIPGDRSSFYCPVCQKKR
ncbi:MAG: bifunctional DNA-formamidopyrimidine glycosylase/DNA-(apurinic or apyrimidinic site) lyase [Nitrospirales bacterium]|nr:bifunctional DNA-formamidopyrimidine glycosylase/DNA-(apurinic or apyrimidinic site) lyase [Nitrospirales bacterium]